MTQLLPSDTPEPSHLRDIPALWAGINELRPKIGTQPPLLESEADRERVYATWSELVREARARVWPPALEHDRLAIHPELYRMGHNLGVRGSGDLVDRYLIGFNLAGAHLAVNPDYERLASAEQSLGSLRQLLGPARDEEVEAMFVILRLSQHDAPGLNRAVDEYLMWFPDTQRALQFQRLRATLFREMSR